MRLELAQLRPAPTKLVANLPYGIAAGVLLRTIAVLERMTLWVAMVQREVGERLAASPGGSAYGTPSVLAQLACEVELVRSVSRMVFYPVPNVDSVLVRLRRRPGARQQVDPKLRALVGASFAHRRKTLAGSVVLAGGELGRSREQVREALAQLGMPRDVRAERLAPQQFVALARALEL